MERRTEIIEEHLFFPMSREDRNFPPAPPDAVLEYQRLKEEWLMGFPKKEGVEPMVALFPRNIDGRIRYIVSKELVISE
jgi:hypothetical protein